MSTDHRRSAIALVLLFTVNYVCSLPLSSSQKDEEFWRRQAAVRATLITKDNFLSKRQQKSNAIVPPPFVVSTKLNVHANPDGSTRRGGRSYPDKDGSVVVEGIRVPDDDSDRITWRNGRVINNVFVPNDAEISLPTETVVTSSRSRPRQPKSYTPEWPRSSSPYRQRSGLPYHAYNFDDHYRGRTPDLPDSLAVESRQSEVVVSPPERLGSSAGEASGESRDYSYHAGNTNAGRPVYYVVEEQDSLHSDRSPYDFEPADANPNFASAIVSDYTQAGGLWHLLPHPQRLQQSDGGRQRRQVAAATIFICREDATKD